MSQSEFLSYADGVGEGLMLSPPPILYSVYYIVYAREA